MMSDREATHLDYLSVIGGTAATAKGRYEQSANAYFLRSAQVTVGALLAGERRGSVLDVGTSHGVWLPYLRAQGFDRILGVELDPERARLARATGYDLVFECDAAEIPLDSDSVDCAVSNDVFVHILRLADKASVLAEVERVLKPDGVFVFNQVMARPFGHSRYTVVGHNSFLTLAELIHLVSTCTTFAIEDARHGYFAQPTRDASGIERILRNRPWLPGAVSALLLFDRVHMSRRGLDEGDYVYLKVRKQIR